MFENLERLTLETISFHRHHVVDAMAAMPRLTHIAVRTGFYLGHAARTGYEQGIVRLLARTNLKRMVIGWNMATWIQRESINGFTSRQQLLASLPANDLRKVVFLVFGHGTFGDTPERDSGWFTDRVLDGTVWELECQMENWINNSNN